MFDKILKYFGLVWSIIVTVAVAVFFLGSEWKIWTDMKAAYLKGSDEQLSQFVTHSVFESELAKLGWGETYPQPEGSDNSAVCPPGQFIAGLRYNIATGDNAGSVYNGVWPVCRSVR